MELVITQNITLDGVVESVDGWFDPADDDDASDVVDVLRTQMEAEDGFLVGRRTFEDMRGFWPHQTDDTTGITAHLDAVAKYVVSSTLTDPGWGNSTVLAGDPVEEVAALKARPGGDLGVTGSIELCHALVAAGLVDEYRLFTYPVVIGRGRRLFPHGADRLDLELVDSRRFRSGIVLSTYRPT
ncbi:dihydrofolate reductase family protein [Iamia majanohamensis]|uniref:Dihydrofolate reductase family protein n=1 Tax=Iamia majanohamensis TaxID=467976 RepID=A0AAE9Y3A3_9ACTN|nr:dihydrofolate reductase family protein [Iamia majanohamensis]WCO65630.1 dihydrofolate reductase family protein [Iamia majanohamensis]